MRRVRVSCGCVRRWSAVAMAKRWRICSLRMASGRVVARVGGLAAEGGERSADPGGLAQRGAASVSAGVACGGVERGRRRSAAADRRRRRSAGGALGLDHVESVSALVARLDEGAARSPSQIVFDHLCGAWREPCCGGACGCRTWSCRAAGDPGRSASERDGGGVADERSGCDGAR